MPFFRKIVIISSLSISMFFYAAFGAFAQEIPLGEAWSAVPDNDKPKVEQILRDTKLVPAEAKITSESLPTPASGDTFIPASNDGQAACYAAYAVAIVACGDDNKCREVADAALKICLITAE